ncbi:hypothetical protein [Prevotella melaninogenica]
MNIDKARQARDFLSELDDLKEIKRHTEQENIHWWSFLTPEIINENKDGLKMHGVLREEFTKAVDRSIKQLEKQIEEL